MAWTEFVLNAGIVLGPLILVLDHEANRRARGLSLEYTRDDGNRVGFTALRGMSRLARFSLIYVGLDIYFREHHARRAAVHYTAKRGTMAFAEGRETEKMAECIMRHRCKR